MLHLQTHMPAEPLFIQIDVNLRISDLYWFYFSHALGKGVLVRRYLYIALVVLVAAFGERLTFLSPSIRLYLPYAFVVLPAYFFIVWPFSASRYKVRGTVGVSGVVRYIFNDLGVDVLGAGQTHYDWSSIQKAQQTSTLFWLSLNDGSSVFLPKRCIKDAQQGTLLRSLLVQKITKRII